MDNDSATPVKRTPKPVPKPVAKPAPEAVPKPVPKPVAKPVPKPAAQPAPEPKQNTQTKKMEPVEASDIKTKTGISPARRPEPAPNPVSPQHDASPKKPLEAHPNPAISELDAITVLNKLYEAMIITDSAGTVIAGNIRVTNLLGYDVPELAGRNVQELFPSLNDSIIGTIWSGVKQGKHTVIEMPFRKKNGTVMDTETSVSSIEWQDGLSMCFSIRDNTRHKTQESMFIAMNNAIANTAVGIVVTNPEWRVEFANPAFMKITNNKDDAGVIGRSILEFIDDKKSFEELLAELPKGGTRSLACRLKSAGGAVPVHVSGSWNVDHDGNQSGTVLTFDDICVLHESQEQKLETERVRARLDTMATLSHHIESPMQKLMSMAEFDERADYRQEISRIAETLQKLCQENSLTKTVHPDGVTRFDIKTEPEPVSCAEARILVVEKEDMIRNLFRRILKSSFPKATVDLASSPGEAMDQLSNTSCSVVILDVMAPDVNARAMLEQLSRICAAKQWKLPHIIFCAGFLPEKEIRDMASDGTTHKLLRKPVAAAVLTEAVGAFLPQ